LNNKGIPHVSAAFDLFPARARFVAAALVLAVATGAAAQNAAQQSAPAGNSTGALRLPNNPQFFGQALPSVVKATALVNGAVITQTDIDQRLQETELAYLAGSEKARAALSEQYAGLPYER